MTRVALSVQEGNLYFLHKGQQVQERSQPDLFRGGHVGKTHISALLFSPALNLTTVEDVLVSPDTAGKGILWRDEVIDPTVLVLQPAVSVIAAGILALVEVLKGLIVLASILPPAVVGHRAKAPLQTEPLVAVPLVDVGVVEAAILRVDR